VRTLPVASPVSAAISVVPSPTMRAITMISRFEPFDILIPDRASLSVESEAWRMSA
jgi:hypothetical protein